MNSNIIEKKNILFYSIFFVFSLYILSFSQQFNSIENFESIKKDLLKKLPSKLSENIDSLEQDSAVALDSLRTKKEKNDSLEIEKEKKELSIYENILKSKIVDPDSLLTELDIFGYSIFKNRSKLHSFVSEKQVSVPADYPVSPGDEILVTMWGRINEEIRTNVDRNGTINIPRIGPVSVGGLPFEIAQKNITNKVQSIGGVKALVSIGVLSDVRVFIIGEVTFPGQYTIHALSNVTNALFSAGGFSKKGSMRTVKLIRGSKTIKEFDFYDFLLSGNNFSNVRLKTGDVIHVSMVKKMAAVAGNVRRSALYELRGNETLSDLINLAGGFTPTAWVNRIQVERFKNNDQKVVFDLEVQSIDNLPKFAIQDGDMIKIFPVVKMDQNVVFLSGNVQRPGKYQYHENMRISDIISHYDQLKPESYFNYAVIHRKEPPSFNERIISFNLGEVLTDSSSAENIPLLPLDSIIVYNIKYFEPDRDVSIGGAITKKGIYSLLHNMHIKDLILEAGGLTDEASVERGELYKRVFQNDSVYTQKIDFCVSCAMDDDPDHNLPLSKSDYVFIRKKRGWEEQVTITLKGEFVYPGTYIVLEDETLEDVIARAGGFTSNAFLPGAIFTRESVKEIESKRTKDYITQLEADIASVSSEMAMNGISEENASLMSYQKELLEKLKQIEFLGRIVIDFTKLENYKDLPIENGDILYIPKNLNTVSVIGEVYNPATFVLRKDDRAVEQYVELAGGFKDEANDKNVYIIKANGSVRTRKMVRVLRYKLEPGDAVVVPRKIPVTGRFRTLMGTINSINSLMSSTLLTVSALLAIKNAP